MMAPTAGTEGAGTTAARGAPLVQIQLELISITAGEELARRQ